MVRRNLGFTLIELVVVIVILGILAVIAMPKYIDLKPEAKASTIKGLASAIQSYTTMSIGEAQLNGRSLKSGFYQLDGVGMLAGLPLAQDDKQLITKNQDNIPMAEVLEAIRMNQETVDEDMVYTTEIATDQGRGGRANLILAYRTKDIGANPLPRQLRDTGCYLVYKPGYSGKFDLNVVTGGC